MREFKKAQATLEFNKITEELASHALTEGSRRRCLALCPISDVYRIKIMQSQTSDAKKLLEIKGMPPFGRGRDISMLLDRAEKGASLTPRELLDVADIYTAARRLDEYINSNKRGETALDENFSLLTQDRPFEDRINRSVESEDTLTDEASPTLSDIRRKIRNSNNKIKDNLSKYTSGAYSKYLQENIVTQRNGRYVIPVRIEYKNEIKGLVHDTSASGATLFIEPMSVVEENNRLRELQSEEKHEVDRILAELSAECAARSGDLSYNLANIDELAFIFARAALSEAMEACEPIINENHRTELYHARHPLLDKKKAVPITIMLGGAFDTLVITGPNTGGKTVSLKTLGLLSMMAQSGLHIPAEDTSQVCVVENILADIGDEQSIEQSLSTFSAHMVNIVGILKAADKNSLVLFDELGAGTDPVEGAALATAILESVRERGSLCAATTHYAELKAYALREHGVTNASCEFDIETLKPTYKLIIGTPGKSNAFAISKKLGLDQAIIERAQGHVSSDNKKFENVIEQLEKTRMEMESERERASTLRREYEEKKKNGDLAYEEQKKRAERELEKAQAQAQGIIRSASLTSQFVMDELEKVKKQRNSAVLADSMESARAAIRKRMRDADDRVNPVIERKAENYVLPRPLKIGDTVEMVDIGRNGTVQTLPDRDGNITVRAGIINTKTKVSNLILIEEEAKISTGGKKITAAAYTKSVSHSFSPELDLRGQNGEDGRRMTDKYLDEAQMAGMHIVTIIHGKGTGVLKKILREYLRGDSRVKSFREGMYGEGDGGVTIVELK